MLGRVSQPWDNWHCGSNHSLLEEGCPVHCRMVGTIPDLYRLGAILPPPLQTVTTKNISWDCQMSPGRHNNPWLRSILLEIHTNAMKLTTKDRHKSDSRVVASRKVPRGAATSAEFPKRPAKWFIWRSEQAEWGTMKDSSMEEKANKVEMKQILKLLNKRDMMTDQTEKL